MKDIHLIVVGKLKDKNLEALEDNYLKRIKSPKLHIHEVKSHKENLDLEANEVEKKLNDIGATFPILLAENGQLFDSPKMSKWLFNLLEVKSEKIVFIIGGASGHGEKIIQRSKQKLSLSPLTYPHKLARILFVEQIYRALTINSGHPYHK
ncbi:23S rRNA (pseudouridine(1915)-N(3))-methyltransferase RlmH [Halobacteriovorax sp. JY17]|uniref:23S rRNA (pseudouridine(1915)-N(3))-methyltransferase RlmH n=1 Tax=Halobacteriovorax sp. JY17 TaxID=2014617 RepID=UPI000C4390CA|nr:23S rRNA (pseudouridine(1915)-N(3))-methyltransferase RlmH [Halobacteriovorax sp. JY17]PIK13902.1 MAG: 23S rRNA (pseudouridine(1915)-N(3))-methyltransferase RlmH [Halobacteriovorax sp. JY17]